jgi:glycosyltransferase involved in cell wall biosynthesis
MKVLFLSQWYPNKHQPYLGIFVREQIRAIALAGHHVQVIALTLHSGSQLLKKEIYSYTDEYGIEVTHCELHSRLKDLLYHLPFLQELFLREALKLSIGKNGKPDLIHAQVIYPAGIWAYHIARKWQVPYVVTEHWSRISLLPKSIYYRRAGKAYQSAKKILPVSSFLANKITTAFPCITKEDCLVTGNVVDSAVFHYQEKAPSDTLTFCAVATWNKKKIPDKMPELFIDALSHLQKTRQIKLRLLMIGGGDMVPELAELCRKAGIETHFSGFLSKEKIAEHLHEADYFVHASAIETFSIVVAEALACGLPVICSDTGALPELVDDSNGILCGNTTESWRAAVEKAISVTFNRKDIARNIEHRFGLKAIGEKISSVYLS